MRRKLMVVVVAVRRSITRDLRNLKRVLEQRPAP
jgi:hypothetical protein